MTSYADDILSAMQDAGDLVPWARANDNVQTFGSLAKVVETAMHGPVPTECAFFTPLLRQTDRSLCAVPLLAAVTEWRLTVEDSCCLCKHEVISANRLTVLAGASAVWMHFCPKCRDLLDETFADLHWDSWEDA
jgi:hypothetical protein